VTQTGYRRDNGGYEKRSLPPVAFEYTQPIVQDKVEDVNPASVENLPIGVGGSTYQWTDLHGEGIPGILTEQGKSWFYKRNLSPISEHDAFVWHPSLAEDDFGLARRVAQALDEEKGPPSGLLRMASRCCPTPPTCSAARLPTEVATWRASKADGRFPNADPDDHWRIPAGRVFLSPNSADTARQELAYARSHFCLPHPPAIRSTPSRSAPRASSPTTPMTC
jgi:hypothetical protein